VTRIRHAVIMAAGRGRRMMPLTDDLPKPMAPYLDSTLIAHGIDRVRARVPDVHVTVGYLAAKLAPHLVEHGVSSIINTDGMSNSWWLYNTLLRHLDEPVFTLTCDNVTDLDFEALEADYLAQGSPAGMLVPVRPVDGLEGDWIFHDDGVVSGVDRHRPSESYCSGIQILNPAAVNRLTTEGDDFYDVWRQLIAHGQLRCSNVFPRHWFTVDTVADLGRLGAAGSALT
jgi:NDP-sugar pyrophosphorylase family protein